jgi:hypothetical protein
MKTFTCNLQLRMTANLLISVSDKGTHSNATNSDIEKVILSIEESPVT